MQTTRCPSCGSDRGLLDAALDAQDAAAAPGVAAPFARTCPRCLLEGALGAWPEARDEVEPDAFLAGRAIGGYEVLGRIGAGSTGTVYRARQRGLDRLVALKVLTIPGGRAPIERFLDEARALARLRHPGIVGIFEVGTHEGRHFYAMDLVDGPTLAQALRAGPLEPGRAARLLARIARAVDHAHAMGIVHRDLKPANILLERTGEPRVADFGLARDALAAAPSHEPALAAIGTAPYMAPEQAGGRAHAADARTDVYGLGAVLYECLTSEPPFRGERLQEILARVRSEAPRSPRAIRPDLDPALVAICLRALEKDPARRFPSAGELAAALEGWSERTIADPGGARRTAARARRAALWLAACVIGAALLLGPDGARTARSRGAASGATHGSEVVPATAPAATGGTPAATRASTARIRGEGPPRAPRSRSVRPAALAPRTIELGLGPIDAVHVSPDGALVAIVNAGALMSVLETATGLEVGRAAVPVGAIRAVAFLEEAQAVAVGGTRGGLAVVDLATGAVTASRAVTTGAVPVIAASPDGSLLALGRDDGTTWILGAERDRVLRTLPGDGARVGALAFDASGDRLAVASDGGDRVTLWDTGRGAALGSLGPVARPVRMLAFSASGDALAVLSRSGALNILSIEEGLPLGPANLPTTGGATLFAVARRVGPPEDAFQLARAGRGEALADSILVRGPVGARLSFKLTGHEPVAQALSADGRTLAVANANHSVSVFGLEEDSAAVRPTATATPPPPPVPRPAPERSPSPPKH